MDVIHTDLGHSEGLSGTGRRLRGEYDTSSSVSASARVSVHFPRRARGASEWTLLCVLQRATPSDVPTRASGDAGLRPSSGRPFAPPRRSPSLRSVSTRPTRSTRTSPPSPFPSALLPGPCVRRRRPVPCRVTCLGQVRDVVPEALHRPRPDCCRPSTDRRLPAPSDPRLHRRFRAEASCRTLPSFPSLLLGSGHGWRRGAVESSARRQCPRARPARKVWGRRRKGYL